jgi:hypothetical protein
MEIAISTDLLSEILNTDSGEIAAALKESEESDNLKPKDQIEAYIKSSIQSKIKGAVTDAHEQGRGRGTKEAYKQLEQSLADRYGLKPTGKVDELIEQVIASQRTKIDIDDNTIRSHEVYLNDLKKIKTMYDQTVNDFETFKSDISKRELKSELIGKIEAYATENKYILPGDPGRRKNNISLFVDTLFNQGVNIIGQDGKIMLTDKEGKALKDDMMNEVNFEKWLSEKISMYYEKQEGDTRQSPGRAATGSGVTGGKSYSFPSFKDVEEATAYAYKIKDSEERKAFLVHMDSLRKQGQMK